jgi:hypothetical protein
MSRKQAFLALAMVLAFLFSAGAGLGVLLQHEPRFYREVALASGPERQVQSRACVGQSGTLISYFQLGSDTPWEMAFTQDQLNSFFAEDFVHHLGDTAKDLERQGISDPRVSMDKDRLRLAFRYSHALFSTVISLDLRLWLVPKEMNVFAVEILGRQAGALPISSQALQDEIANLARKCNFETSWFRHDGHPVALLRVKNQQSRPATKFQRLELQAGKLLIGGVSLEPLPPNAQFKKLTAPVGN